MAETSPPSSAAQGLGFTLIASVIWGSSFVAIQAGLDSASPLLLASLRFLFAAGGVLLIAGLLSHKIDVVASLRNPMIWGIGGLDAVGFALSFVGQAYGGIADATLLSNLFPAIVPLLAVPLLQERLSRTQGMATMLSMVGLAAVALPNFRLGASTLLGDGLLVGSAVAYALFIVLSKRAHCDSPASAFALILVMGMVLAPVFLVTAATHPASLRLPLEAWSVVLYLAIPCTLVALVFYLTGLRSISASRSSLLLLLEPVTGLALAALWYRGSLNLPILIGGALIIGAIAMTCWPNPEAGRGTVRSVRPPKLFQRAT
jgi:O-acetylserine/cysteine efflux transporter